MLIVLVHFQALGAVVCAADSSPQEYDVKAALLYKILPFVKWPEADTERSTLTIGVIGKNPFGDALKAIEGRKIGSLSIVVKHFKSHEELAQFRQCQVLYIAEHNQKKLSRILRSIAGLPILTIGDSPEFAEQGGMIGFVEYKKRIAFEINRSSVIKAKLVIRSKFMRLAVRIVSAHSQPKDGSNG